ncbi:MAG: terminase small subunit [Planctomycetota bacterium]|jgi:phage terminase small subunit
MTQDVQEELGVPVANEPGFRWTLKKQKFVYHYVRNGGLVAKACKEAGYADRASGSELLTKPTIRDAIQRELLACLQKEGENSETIMARWSNWIKANIYDYFKMDEEGILLLRPKEELTEDQQLRVKKITASINQYGQNISVELHDVSKAQDRMAEILGLINSQTPQGTAEETAHAIRDLVGKMHETRFTEAPDDVTVN